MCYIWLNSCHCITLQEETVRRTSSSVPGQSRAQSSSQLPACCGWPGRLLIWLSAAIAQRLVHPLLLELTRSESFFVLFLAMLLFFFVCDDNHCHKVINVVRLRIGGSRHCLLCALLSEAVVSRQMRASNWGIAEFFSNVIKIFHTSCTSVCFMHS